MVALLKKELKISLLFCGIFLVPVIILWWFKRSDQLFPIAVFVQLSLTYVISILTVMANEQEEELHNGYRFLKILPIKRWRITFIKFLVPFLLVSLLGMVNRVVYTLFHVGQDALTISDTITLIFSVLVLLNCALILIGVYLLGYTRFIQVTTGLITFFFLGGFLMAKLFRVKVADLNRVGAAIQNWLLHGDHLLFLLCGLVLYLIMGILANRIWKK